MLSRDFDCYVSIHCITLHSIYFTPHGPIYRWHGMQHSVKMHYLICNLFFLGFFFGWRIVFFISFSICPIEMKLRMNEGGFRQLGGGCCCEVDRICFYHMWLKGDGCVLVEERVDGGGRNKKKCFAFKLQKCIVNWFSLNFMTIDSIREYTLVRIGASN